MSETTSQPAADEPRPNAPSVDPPATPTQTPPEAPPAPPEPSEEQKERDAEGRRLAALRARLGAAERAQEQQRIELEHLRRQAQQYAPLEETPEQQHMRLREQIRTEEQAKIRAERFHEEGAAAHPDWKQKCDELVAMGADANFAKLLVEMPGGVRVAAALAGEPAEVERIASMRTEQARSFALGKFAATLDNGVRPHVLEPALTPTTTRAPPPVRPVTGRVSPTFNEYTADAQTLIDKYMKDDLDKRMGKR